MALKSSTPGVNSFYNLITVILLVLTVIVACGAAYMISQMPPTAVGSVEEPTLFVFPTHTPTLRGPTPNPTLTPSPTPEASTVPTATRTLPPSITPTPTNTPTATNTMTTTLTSTITSVGTATFAPTATPNPNMALNRPATSSSNENSGLTANLAVDGNATTTRWASAPGSDPQWIYVDLGSTQSVSRVILRWEASYAKAYVIQTSNDATNWTQVYSTTTGDGGLDDLTVTTSSGRYVRMYGTQRATSSGYSLFEFEVYQ